LTKQKIGLERKACQLKKKERKTMKKLMMIAAALLVAGVTQAATVNWNWNAGIFMDQEANNINNGTVALYFTSVLPGGSAFSSGAVVGGVAVGSYSADHTALNNPVTYRFTTTILGNSYYADSVFTISGLVGGGDPADSTKLEGYMDGAFTDLLNRLGADGTFNLTTTTGWTAVPEPTSFALLGLGAAALALRRRIRKA
jgi:hypothetical protein